MSVVIDTNVAIIANDKNPNASVGCIDACIEALQNARLDVVLVDNRFEIFQEYHHHLSFSGQPGVGDAFFKWLWDHQADTRYSRQVTITPSDNPARVFEEFPDDHALDKFDPSDRKFVAVALASADNPMILNASDTDWWIHRVALYKHGVQLSFLCPDLMEK